MSGLVVCRVVGPDSLREFTERVERSAVVLQCRQRLSRARRDGRPIAHVYSHWPDLTGLLPGCSPVATEPVFRGPFKNLLAHDPFEAFCRSTSAQRTLIIGTIDRSLLNSALYSAQKLGVALHYDDGATLVL